MAIIRPKSLNFKIGHDGILSIGNFMLIILLLQLPGNWTTTKKCAPYFRGNTEFPIYFKYKCFNCYLKNLHISVHSKYFSDGPNSPQLESIRNQTYKIPYWELNRIDFSLKSARADPKSIMISSKYGEFFEFWNSDFGWTPIVMDLVGVHPKNIYCVGASVAKIDSVRSNGEA
jgi:hypothetical protein